MHSIWEVQFANKNVPVKQQTISIQREKAYLAKLGCLTISFSCELPGYTQWKV